MTTTSLLTFAPIGSIAPDYARFAFDHDFVLDGRPQSFKRNGDGSLIPAIGAAVGTLYGLGYIERRHVGGDVIVRITEFDETVEVPQYADPVKVNAFRVVKGYITGREQVAILSSLYNNRTMNKALWFESHMRDVAYAEELMELVLDDDCYQVRFTGGDYGGCTQFVYAPAVNPVRGKKSTAETAAYRARIAALADKMLDDADDTEVVPEGIADELAECFGE
jgi:hypothetical protein